MKVRNGGKEMTLHSLAATLQPPLDFTIGTREGLPKSLGGGFSKKKSVCTYAEPDRVKDPGELVELP